MLLITTCKKESIKMRYDNFDLKKMGFVKFNSTNAMVKNDGFRAIASYGLIIALYDLTKNIWVSACGKHDYSSTTSKQVTQITGVCTSDRRKTWVINDNDFRLLENKFKKLNW